MLGSLDYAGASYPSGGKLATGLEEEGPWKKGLDLSSISRSKPCGDTWPWEGVKGTLKGRYRPEVRVRRIGEYKCSSYCCKLSCTSEGPISM